MTKEGPNRPPEDKSLTTNLPTNLVLILCSQENTKLPKGGGNWTSDRTPHQFLTSRYHLSATQPTHVRTGSKPASDVASTPVQHRASRTPPTQRENLRTNGKGQKIARGRSPYNSGFTENPLRLQLSRTGSTAAPAVNQLSEEVDHGLHNIPQRLCVISICMSC